MFTDGRWLARYLPAGTTAGAPWVMDVPANQIVWFDASCHLDPAKSHLFPYRQRAWFGATTRCGRRSGRSRYSGHRISAV